MTNPLVGLQTYPERMKGLSHDAHQYVHNRLFLQTEGNP